MDLTYFSSKTEKRPSAIEGRGLFAREPISEDEIVVVKGGYVMAPSQRDEVELRMGPAEIQITEDLFIGPTSQEEREGGMMHLNHSCDPNLGVQGQIVFVAMHDIAADEELTFDYAMTDDEPYEMECNCGAPICRRVITGRDWTTEELQRRYNGYFSWFIQRRVDAAQGQMSANPATGAPTLGQLLLEMPQDDGSAMTNSFYVYENWTHDRARVHRAECPFCNHGRGIHGTNSERNGKWHPPFTDRDAAYRFAHGTPRSDIAGCANCTP